MQMVRTFTCFAILLLCGGQVVCLAAAPAVVSVSATILSQNQCKFANPSSQTLAFGTLDPLNAVDVTTQVQFSFSCNGKDNPATFSITDNDGLYETGPDRNRMQNLTTPSAFLPYTLVYSPTSGSVPKGSSQTLTVTGTVKGSDYQTAYVGDYSDTVTLTIQP
jgi:spore coat protein U domain-containing protein, fimbrial subunit CupE1/2/3/6